MPRDKERVKAYNRQYHIDHKEEMNAKSREWYHANKEEAIVKNKQYKLDHKEEINSKHHQWIENHKEQYKVYQQQYQQSEEGKKSRRISDWKNKAGILSDDYDALYDKFLNTEKCEECDCELVFGNCKNGRTLDHDHSTGLVRNILCRSCNSKRR